MEGFQLDLGLHLDLSSESANDLSSFIDTKESDIRDRYARLIPRSHIEKRKDSCDGYFYIDITTPGTNIQVKKGSVETQSFQALGQAIQAWDIDREKTSIILLAEVGKTNKKRKTTNPGVAANCVRRVVPKLGIPNLIVLVERWAFLEEDMARNIKIIRSLDREFISKKYPPRYELYEREAKEIDIKEIKISRRLAS